MYWKPAVGVGIVTVLVTYAYAIAAYGLLLGGGLGWIPAMIVGFLAGALWPLTVASGAIVGFIAFVGFIQSLPVD